MRRPFTITTCALVFALAPAALFAQTAPPAQPPAQPAAQPAQKNEIAFTSDAGLLLVQIKPDQTAAFEEFMTKLEAIIAKSAEPTAKDVGASLKTFKSAEPMNSNALYIVMIDPAVKAVDYSFFALAQKYLTKEELGAPETQELFKKVQPAFASVNRLNLTPVAK